jgi:hypothetical protein
VMSPLLKGVDLLNTMVQDVQNQGEVDFSAVSASLEQYLDAGKAGKKPAAKATKKDPATPKADANSTPAEAAPAPTGATGPNPLHGELGQILFNLPEYQVFSPDFEDVRKALAQGKRLYAITLNEAEDIEGQQRSLETLLEQLNTFGVTLQHKTGLDANQQACIQVLYSSVLEIDLFPDAANLPEEQVKMLKLPAHGQRTQWIQYFGGCQKCSCDHTRHPASGKHAGPPSRATRTKGGTLGRSRYGSRARGFAESIDGLGRRDGALA